MRIYVGQTRSKWLIAELAQRGYGECCVRGELPPRRHPWFYDNGAFKDWRSGAEFDAEAFERDLHDIRAHGLEPDFYVCPDKPAAPDSLEFSRSWLPHMAGMRPLYLAVQDGMPFSARVLRGFDGIFVGGTLEWKLASGERWVNLAHCCGVPCHIGRVGTGKRVRWAKRIGVDSIDSCLPLWSRDNLRQFDDAINDPQLELIA